MRFSKTLADFVSLPERREFQTPCYVYSEAVLRELQSHFRACLGAYRFPIPVRWHYAMKANALPRLMRFFHEQGAGVDLVSGGELGEALACGYTPQDLVFSGIGKKTSEIELALREQVFMINVESESELKRLRAAAEKLSLGAAYSLRVNPDVDAKTHPYISTGLWEHKFGLPFEQAYDLYTAFSSARLQALGISLHIGSQIFDIAVLSEAIDKTVELARRLGEAGVNLEVLDVGGGLGVDYTRADEMPNFEGYARFLHEAAEKWSALTRGRGRLVFECGRAFTAQAGYLLTEVIGIKKSLKKNFLIVDGSMTELLRPALYRAEHPVWSASSSALASEKNLVWEIVGPVCESSDVLAREVPLSRVAEGDFLLLGCAGAYGASMSQTYNARPLPEEWWIDSEGRWQRVRKSQSRSFEG